MADKLEDLKMREVVGLPVDYLKKYIRLAEAKIKCCKEGKNTPPAIKAILKDNVKEAKRSLKARGGEKK